MVTLPYRVNCPPYDPARPVEWKRAEHREGKFFVQFGQNGFVYAGSALYDTPEAAKPELDRIN